MTFGRLDWTSWDSILSKKSVTLGLGLVALAGSFAVLGATVLRIQNLRTTVDRPKASGTGENCSRDGLRRRLVTVHWCKFESTTASGQQCGSNPVSNLNVKVKSYAGVVLNGDGKGDDRQDMGIDSLCEGDQHTIEVSGMSNSPAVFYCTNNENVKYENGSANCGSGVAATKVNGSSATFSLPEGKNPRVYMAFVSGAGDGSSSGGGGRAYYTATYPTGGTVVSSLTPTFTWNANTTGITYNNICIGTDSSCNSLPCSWSPSTSDRSYTLPASANLQPNTTYYWVLYGQPGNPAPGTGCQSFRTGVTPEPAVVKSCSVSLSSSSIAAGSRATVTYSGTGISNDLVRVWLSKAPNFSAISPAPANQYVWNPGTPPLYEVDYQIASCPANGNSCSASTDATLPAGQYYLHCDIQGGSNQCSGSPGCTYETGINPSPSQQMTCSAWRSCSSNDNVTLTVNIADFCAGKVDGIGCKDSQQRDGICRGGVCGPLPDHCSNDGECGNQVCAFPRIGNTDGDSSGGESPN